VVALEVFKTVRALGLSIPTDLSLIAFHDADWTSVTSPPITVISQPVYDLGVKSAQLLIKRITGSIDAPRRLVLATTLIERQSVDAPATPVHRVKEAMPPQATKTTAG
jgi:LacI family transcriptional regulator